MQTRDAIQLAMDQGLDLVEVDGQSNPPVCRVIDYGKFSYEQSKKLKLQKPKQIESKEVRFTPGTDANDIDTKLRQVTKFLNEGKNVRITVRYKKRQLAHADEGYRIIEAVAKAIEGIGKLENNRPRMEGRQLTTQVIPNTIQK